MLRDGGKVVFGGRAANLRDLHATPVPDFDEYFYARRESGYAQHRPRRRRAAADRDRARLLVGHEASLHVLRPEPRRHGIPRQAEPQQVLDMLESLSRRYGRLDFNAIDNIMAPEYAEQLFGRLAEAEERHSPALRDPPPFQARRSSPGCATGGLISVQPGIESLSTHILKLMKKHSTGMRNLELMKWCTYYGINNLYNILVGFAGETAEDYRLQCEVIGKIPHFQPPYAIAKARADRGSPMFTEPDRHGVGRLRPADCYRYIFPRGRFDLNRISYYFDHDGPGMLPDHEYDEIFARSGPGRTRWRDGARPTPALSKIMHVDLHRGRPRRRGAAVRLLRRRGGALRVLHGRENRARRSRPSSAKRLAGGALAEFRERDLMIEMDGQYLSLALPKNAYV